MNPQERNLISYVRAVLTSRELVSTPEELLSCVGLAYEHGVSNLLYYAVAQMPRENRPSVDQCGSLKRIAYAASTRELLQQKNVEAVLEAFEHHKIHVLPLKGTVLKHLYPKPEFRHMSDIDLLIDPKQASAVRSCLESLGFKTVKYDAGNTDFYVSSEGLNFELHRDLSNEGVNDASKLFLSELLGSAVPIENRKYICRLSDEAHYAYVLCHIAKHLINGGIGLRPIMDVWICRKHMQLNPDNLGQLLTRLELCDFAARMEHLAEVWFGDEEMSALDEEIGTYILGSGSFGTEQQRVADRMLKSENQNRFTYLLRRLFPNYATMSRYFPSLKKCPVLLPAYWLWRWLRAVFCRGGKLTAEIDTVRAIDSDVLQQRAAFYQRCGLHIYRKE